MFNVATATSSSAADDGADCRRVARSATRKSIRPPARARSGSGMPYLLRVLWPRTSANSSAKPELPAELSGEPTSGRPARLFLRRDQLPETDRASKKER